MLLSHFKVDVANFLGQVLLNIFIFSMFTNIDFTNCADDITLHVIVDGAKVAIDSLKNVLDELFCWFATILAKIYEINFSISVK